MYITLCIISSLDELHPLIMAWFPTWLQPSPQSEKLKEGSFTNIEVTDRTLTPLSKSTPPSPTELQRENSSISPTELQYDMNEEEEQFFRHGPEMAIPMTGATLGFVAGFYTAATRSGLIFMAENAHRRPDTVQGWYFYNKTKNYKVLLGGAKGGARAGLQVGLWTLAYVAIEQGVEKARLSYTQSQNIKPARWNGRWIDGATAGLGIATGASFLYRLSPQIASRSVLLGMIGGASIGALRQLQGELAEAKLQAVHQTS